MFKLLLGFGVCVVIIIIVKLVLKNKIYIEEIGYCVVWLWRIVKIKLFHRNTHTHTLKYIIFMIY